MNCPNQKHKNRQSVARDKRNQMFFQDRLEVQQHDNFCQVNYTIPQSSHTLKRFLKSYFENHILKRSY